MGPISLAHALLLKLCLCRVNLSSNTRASRALTVCLSRWTGQVNKKEKKKETGYTDYLILQYFRTYCLLFRKPTTLCP